MSDEKELKSIIRKNYLDILNREPDEEGLNHYLQQMQTGKITSNDLRQIFMDSQEYKYLQLVKLRNTDLPTLQRMKKDWDDRAHTDAKFFIRAVYNQSEHEFWKSGKIECYNILGVNSQRYNLIIDGKNPKEMKILEIGCGIGRILIPMAAIFGEAVGVDVSTEMVKTGRKHAKKIFNCTIFENNGSDLSKFPDNYFDFCYSYIVFQHIPEKEIVKNYIKEVSRVLKNGKIFRFQVHGNYDKNPIDGTTWNGVHFTSYEMHQIANESKFTILEEEGQNDRYYWLTFKSIKDAK